LCVIIHSSRIRSLTLFLFFLHPLLVSYSVPPPDDVANHVLDVLAGGIVKGLESAVDMAVLLLSWQ
jgi:hypothetical protein